MSHEQRKHNIMPRGLKRPQQPIDPYRSQSLPVGRPAAVYYRQSSEAQIGNVSTTLQTFDMIEQLIQHGWPRESIHMIDMDAGVSGTKKIRDRKGMSLLYEMIESGRIGLVAAQDVDRFFRDVTMIETNIFIDACKRNNVQVLTPRMVFDFAHPSMGSSHIRMFREDSQRAADYLEYQIRGRLVKARLSRSASGMWAGRRIAPGFMVDCRERVDGNRNPDFRKYKRFDLYADVVLRYFQLFREKSGNLQQTWLHIQQHGPMFPAIPEGIVPEGFRVTDHLNRRSTVTSGWTLSLSGLMRMLVNVTYIGHWVHLDAITQWDNHEAIIPQDLFMYAFNRLSPTDFYGDPNPEYVPYRPWIRHERAERDVEPPTYSGMVYSDDVELRPHQRLMTVWSPSAKKYQYQLSDYPVKSNVWNVKAFIVDELIGAMLLDRLQATTINEAAWAAALGSVETVEQSEVRRIRAAIRQAEATRDNIIANLGVITNPEITARAEAHYEAVGLEIITLEAELARAKSGSRRSKLLADARPALREVIQRWDRVPREDKLSLFTALAKYAKITKITNKTKTITVHWRDDTVSSRNTTHTSLGPFWEDEALDKLRQMVESNADQWEILRAFPEHNWQAIQARYAYNFNDRHWPKSYKGKRGYGKYAQWKDTVEFQQENKILHKSATVTKTLKTPASR